MGRGEGACYLASIITREIVTLFGDHILEASKDKSRPHLLGQIFDVKGWMAAVACPESSRGGSKCWGSGCTLNILDLPNDRVERGWHRLSARWEGVWSRAIFLQVHI